MSVLLTSTADSCSTAGLSGTCDTISMADFPRWPIKEQHNQSNLEPDPCFLRRHGMKQSAPGLWDKWLWVEKWLGTASDMKERVAWS